MNIVKVFSVLSGLSSVKRYSMLKLGAPESVLEHTGMVALMAVIIAEEVNSRILSPLDIGNIAARAVIHDIDEIVTGDIPRPTKYADAETRAAFRKIEDKGVRKVMAEMELDFEVENRLVVLHRVAKEHDEGVVIAIADLLCVVEKTWDEVLVCGNMSLVRHARTISDQISIMKSRVQGNARFHGACVFLFGILDQATHLMEIVDSKSDPIHGAISEEMANEA